MRGNDYMADQVELTGNAVIERLKMDLVPKRVNEEGSVEYYLWAITDQQLHKYLSDAFYGQFVDNTDDLYSVTMPPQRRNKLWIFAPSVELIDWFIDAAADKNNDKADVDGKLKLAYVKMTSVEERLDEGEYPVVQQITHPTTKKLYAYNIKHLSVINQLMLAQLEEGVSEEEMLKSMDERQESLDQQDEQYKNIKPSQASATKAVELNEDDSDDVFGSDDVDVEDESDGAFSDMPDEFDDDDLPPNDAPVFSDEGDDLAFGFDDGDGTVDEDADDTQDLTDDDITTSQSDNTEGESKSAELPKTLQFMVAQINAPLLKTPTVHADNELDSYRQQVDEVRSQLNEQLTNLTETAKQRIISEYYEKHSLAESRIDAKLDPEHGDDSVTSAYQQVTAYNQQDISDVDVLEKEKRQALESQMDEFHSQYIKEALAQAEKDWQSVKDTQYVEEPIQAWRKGVMATVDGQHQERLNRFNEWRERVKSQYLTQVDTPILEELGIEVKKIVDDLKLEQATARQELSQTQDRLFNQNLELQRLAIRKTAEPAVAVAPQTTPEVADPEPESLLAVDNDDNNLSFEDSSDDLDGGLSGDVEEVDDDLPLVEPNEEAFDEESGDIGGLGEANDDDDSWLEEDDTDAGSQSPSDNDVLNLDDSDDDLDLDGLDFDEEDEKPVSSETDDLGTDFGADAVDPDTLPDLDADDDEDLGTTSIDKFVDNSNEDVDEQGVIDNTLADFDEEEDDEVSSVAPDSSTKPSKSTKKSKSDNKKKKANNRKPKKGTSDGKMSKKMMAIIGGVTVLVLVAIIAVVMMFSGGSNGLQVSPSATNTYVKGNMLSGKKDGKSVALVIKEVKGNKLVVSDVSNNKEYTVNKPSSK